MIFINIKKITLKTNVFRKDVIEGREKSIERLQTYILGEVSFTPKDKRGE